ncbi:unnamed protein product [Chondrus crispus]|uniref:Uncharacterized protein n=1 Tax=Chondrus crispus TaxID=2769 RepID=R7Q8R9_CHOCR|nr:unnamed protein product [Chondrus crispus]CDF34917.1 unnamed protein product [Chondrus crispus]|eukprot:XP_005714736.1 unnamed protein product [Chondrus crispus]
MGYSFFLKRPQGAGGCNRKGREISKSYERFFYKRLEMRGLEYLWLATTRESCDSLWASFPPSAVLDSATCMGVRATHGIYCWTSGSSVFRSFAKENFEADLGASY